MCVLQPKSLYVACFNSASCLDIAGMIMLLDCGHAGRINEVITPIVHGIKINAHLRESRPKSIDCIGSKGSNTTAAGHAVRSEEHTSELQSLMRISYAVFCLKKKKKINHAMQSQIQTQRQQQT